MYGSRHFLRGIMKTTDVVCPIRLRFCWSIGTIVIGLAFSGFTGCSPSDEKPQPASTVVVYSSLDDVYARGLAKIFSNKSGIKIQLVTDTEETKSSGILNRLLAEKERPRADVFLSGDPVRANVLQEEGAASQSANDKLALFSARARVLIYNTNRIAAADAPRSVRDLAKPEWAARSCLANPLFGTTAFQAAALFEQWGEKAAKEFFEDFSRNGGTMLSSNGEVRRRVAAGQFAVGLTDSDDANIAITEGSPVGVVFPESAEEGLLVVPCAAVRIKGSPNPEGGKMFIEFLCSPVAEEWMARSPAAHLPLSREVVYMPDIFRGQAEKLRASCLDYAATGRRLRQISSDYLPDWVSRQSR